MVMGGFLIWDGEHTVQYTDDVLQNCTPDIYIILLTNATLVKSIKIKKEKHYKPEYNKYK